MKTSIDLGLWIRLTNTIGQDPNPKNLIGVIYMDLRISITQVPNQYPIAYIKFRAQYFRKRFMRRDYQLPTLLSNIRLVLFSIEQFCINYELGLILLLSPSFWISLSNFN